MSNNNSPTPPLPHSPLPIPPLYAPDLRDRVYQMFVSEVPGMLETIETELVTIGVKRSAEKVHNLLRAAHSIKGCAASLGLEAIRDLAHQIEDIFRVLYHPELRFDRNLENLLFTIYDCLFQLVTAEINGIPLPPGAGTKTQMILANLDEEIGHFVIAGQRLPSDPCVGIDIIRSIFEFDVAQSLHRLERVLLDPASANITVGEFRAQADVFTGIANLVVLPGFGQIAHTTIAALDRHPDRAHEICCFALADFQLALESVLAGDRVLGGSIGAELAQLIAEEPQLAISQIVKSTAGDLFDLEDIFEGESRELIQRADSVLESLQERNLAADEFDLIADFIDLPIVRALVRESEDEFDLLFEELVFTPPAITSAAVPVDGNFGFDLMDLFEPIECGSFEERTAAISAMVARIATDFDSFAPASQSDLMLAGIGAPPKPLKPARLKKARKPNFPAASQLSVRVAVDRLERMNNLVGELAIERHGLALHNEQLDRTLRELRAKCENFQIISDRMRQLADRISISDRAIAPAEERSISALTQDLDREFDLLELDRYGQLHSIAQETIEQLAQIEEQIEDLSLFTTQSNRQIDRQKQLLSHLRDDLMWSRMLPLGEILNRFPRTLHDLSIQYHKPCDLKITGAGVLVDKAAIEKLLDPLVQLLRNAFAHGIDSPEIRQQQGKSPRGLIEIIAYRQGSQTVVEVRDDGGGIDLQKVRAKGIALGAIDSIDAATATPDRLLDLLFYPSFSTADRVTELSGRGMGLDIVKEQIQTIKGTISVESELGRGSTFTIRIPLTLTVAQLTICQAGNALYAFPADSIHRIVVPTTAQIDDRGAERQLHWQHLTIPIYNLAHLLTYSNPISERPISQTLKVAVDNPTDWLPPILLIRTRDRLVGLEIDRAIGEQELTIKPFGKAITPPSYSYGCTILGDGSILPVLDPHTLIRFIGDRSCSESPLPPLPPVDPSKLILVVDDSVTSRQSLCLSLEKYGYRTLQAKDGQVALQLLRQKASEIKLVVCDVEMPNLNGFEFLNIRRQDPTLTQIPVAMLTSRSNSKHRQFATHLGAIAYFVKPYLEADFMTSIAKLVSQG